MTGNPQARQFGWPALVQSGVFEQRQLDETGPATQTMLEILDGEDPRRFQHLAVEKVVRHSSNCRIGDANQLLLRVSREGILKDPLAYLSYTTRLAWREFVVDAGAGIHPGELPTHWMPGWNRPLRSG